MNAAGATFYPRHEMVDPCAGDGRAIRRSCCESDGIHARCDCGARVVTRTGPLPGVRVIRPHERQGGDHA